MRTLLPGIVGGLIAFMGAQALAGLDVPPAPTAPAASPDLSNYARKTDLPTAADTMPPATDVGGATGAASKYARADHTHATSVQRRRWSITVAGQPNEWVFAKPYDPGVVPVVTCTAENVSGATRPFVVNTIGAPTATSVKVAVFQATEPTIGLGQALKLTLFGNAGAGTTVNCQAAKPTQAP